MALRDQLLPLNDWRAHLPTQHWTEADQRAVADVAPGVPTATAAAFLLNHLQRLPEPPANQLAYVYHVARYGTATQTEADLVEFARGDRAADLKHHLALFKAIQDGLQARGVPLWITARSWAEELTHQLLASRDNADYVAGIELGGAMRMETVSSLVRAAAVDRHAVSAAREAALAALMGINAKQAIAVTGQVLADGGDNFEVREKAAKLLAGTTDAEALDQLLKSLQAAPERLALVIATGLADSKEGAERLLTAVAAGKASGRLLQERVVEIRLQRHNLPNLKDRLAKLTEDLPPPDKRFLDLLTNRRTAFTAAKKDPTLGAKVFEKNCAICHRLANQGAKIGPELDGIGIRGLDRLLEDIIDPSRNVDQAFRLTTLNLKNGKIVSGLVLREEGEIVVLANDQGKEVRVPKGDVAERIVSQLSPMPANLINQIPEPDFYNLLAFLLKQRPKS
jgi:putative heme-binding domain-containing protein